MAKDHLEFWLNNERVVEDNTVGTTTLLRFLRDKKSLTGTKEGCAEGDCGACTVVVVGEDAQGKPSFRAINSCLVFLPMVQGCKVYTVEALRDWSQAREDPESGYHPVQNAMVETRGSQCGYCTPGIIMSLFEACYRDDIERDGAMEEQLCGNLCRCTGYRPIQEAGERIGGLAPADRFSEQLTPVPNETRGLDYQHRTQAYLQPTSLAELWDTRAKHPEATLVAGGTDLGLQVTKQFKHFDTVIGLEGIEELKLIERQTSGWRIGAGVQLTRLHEAVGKHLTAVEKMLRVFGSRQIRNRATLGGNLCNASPIGDMAPVLLSLDAQAIVTGPNGDREIPLQSFFESYRKTALRHDEILLAIEIPDPPSNAFSTSYKVSKRRELDISTVAAGMLVDLDEWGAVATIRLAYGGVAATPTRATRTEETLVGQPWTREIVEAVIPVLSEELTPISDHRGSANYRALLARNLLLAFLLESENVDSSQLPGNPSSCAAWVG